MQTMVLLVYVQGRRQKFIRTQSSNRTGTSIAPSRAREGIGRERLAGKTHATLHLAEAGLLRLAKWPLVLNNSR